MCSKPNKSSGQCNDGPGTTSWQPRKTPKTTADTGRLVRTRIVWITRNRQTAQRHIRNARKVRFAHSGDWGLDSRPSPRRVAPRISRLRTRTASAGDGSLGKAFSAATALTAQRQPTRQVAGVTLFSFDLRKSSRPRRDTSSMPPTTRALRQVQSPATAFQIRANTTLADWPYRHAWPGPLPVSIPALFAATRIRSRWSSTVETVRFRSCDTERIRSDRHGAGLCGRRRANQEHQKLRAAPSGAHVPDGLHYRPQERIQTGVRTQ